MLAGEALVDPGGVWSTYGGICVGHLSGQTQPIVTLASLQGSSGPSTQGMGHVIKHCHFRLFLEE